MFFPRALERRWISASQQFPVLLLTGPRQTGKTTLLRQLAGPRAVVTLDDPSIRALARDDPALFLQRYPAPALFDEVQYAPGLLPYIKMRIDENRTPGAFWLTGSQQFSLMKGISETLAGRVAIVHLLGFSSREEMARPLDLPPFLPAPSVLDAHGRTASTETAKDLFRRIWRGSLPEIASGSVQDWDLFWSSYCRTWLERDVRDLAQVGNQSSFLMFVRAVAARTGGILNFTDLARDVDVSPNTAKAWLSVLEATGVVFLLRPWYSNVTSRLIKAPKLLFLETGLAAWLTGWRTPESLESGAMAGAFFETWVIGEVLRSWRDRLVEPDLYYYRDRDCREIDLILHQDGRLWPIEIKASATPKKDWIRHFEALKAWEVGHGAVICLAEDPLPLTDKVLAVPARWL